jgi:hypothetical protein
MGGDLADAVSAGGVLAEAAGTGTEVAVATVVVPDCTWPRTGVAGDTGAPHAVNEMAPVMMAGRAKP